MHNFLPLHGFTPPCQRSPWNSTKKQHWLNDKIVFFLPPLSSWESERLHQSPLPPASFRVATFSSLQDTLPQTLPSSCLPHLRPHTADVIVEGAGRMLKTRWRRRGSRLFEVSPLSSLLQRRKNSQLSISSQKKLPAFMVGGTCREGTWGWDRVWRGRSTNRESRGCLCHQLRMWPLISSVELFLAQPLNVSRGPETYSHPIPPLGHYYNSQQGPPLFQTSLAKDAVPFYHFSKHGSTSSPEDSLPRLPPFRNTPIYL